MSHRSFSATVRRTFRSLIVRRGIGRLTLVKRSIKIVILNYLIAIASMRKTLRAKITAFEIGC